MTQLGGHDADGVMNDLGPKFGGEGGSPPTAPYDRQPARPPEERDRPDRGIGSRSQSDDSRNPEQSEYRNDVDDPADNE